MEQERERVWPAAAEGLKDDAGRMIRVDEVSGEENARSWTCRRGGGGSWRKLERTMRREGEEDVGQEREFGPRLLSGEGV